jgi:hypothetical protein
MGSRVWRVGHKTHQGQPRLSGLGLFRKSGFFQFGAFRLFTTHDTFSLHSHRQFYEHTQLRHPELAGMDSLLLRSLTKWIFTGIKHDRGGSNPMPNSPDSTHPVEDHSANPNPPNVGDGGICEKLLMGLAVSFLALGYYTVVTVLKIAGRNYEGSSCLRNSAPCPTRASAGSATCPDLDVIPPRVT